MFSREKENQLLTRCAQAAQAQLRAADADEANVFRLAAQLVKTSRPAEAENLERAGEQFFRSHSEARKKSFPEVVHSGLVRDLPRMRSLLMRHLQGKKVW